MIVTLILYLRPFYTAWLFKSAENVGTIQTDITS